MLACVWCMCNEYLVPFSDGLFPRLVVSLLLPLGQLQVQLSVAPHVPVARESTEHAAGRLLVNAHLVLVEGLLGRC